MAEGVLVFDDETVTTTEGGSGQAFVILDDSRDVLTFDPDVERQTQEIEGTTDFLVFDVLPATVLEVSAGEDFLLMDPPKEQTVVQMEGSTGDVLVITPGGPPGRQGEQGDPGPQGQPGLAGPGAYYQEFGFASPSTTWTIVHGLNTFGLSVETVDTQGDPLEGYVRYPDANTVEVDWYYPTAGAARLFR